MSKTRAEEIPDVSVIVPHYNDLNKLRTCIRALERQSHPTEKFEVIVVNNDSSPLAITSDTIAIRHDNESRPGSYSARNKGASVARGQILAFTDTDCIPGREWLTEIVAYFANLADDDFIMSGDVCMFSEKNNEKLNYPESYDYVFGINQEIYSLKGSAATANLSMRRDLFSRLGGFEEGLLSGGDGDFCRRAKDRGIKLYFNSRAFVRHPLRSKFDELRTKARRLVGGKLKRNRKVAVLTTLSPPLVRMRILLKKKASPQVKFKAFLVLWYIKSYQAWFLLMFLLGLSYSERR